MTRLLNCEEVSTIFVSRGFTDSCVSTIGNAKRKLEEHQEEDIGIRDDLSNLIPLEVVVLHSSLVASNSIDRIDALLFIEESCSGRSIWEKDG